MINLSKVKQLFVFACFLIASIQSYSQTIYNLADCRSMATLHNKELLIAGEKVQAANSLKKAARTQYLPNFSANGGYIYNQKNLSLLGEDKYLPVYTSAADGSHSFAQSVNNTWTVINGSPVPLDANNQPFNPKTNPEKILWKNYAYMPKDAFEFDSHHVFAGALTMTQPLFMGGKIMELNRIAASNKNIAEAQLEGELSETILQTDVAYWRIVSLMNKEKLANSYVALLKKMETDIEKAISFGVATKSDGLTVKVKLNEVEMSLLQVEDGISLSKMALCQQCGIPLNSEFKLADEDLKPTPETPKGSIDKEAALNNRYEIKSLEQVVNIAESNKKIMLSRFLPNAGLTAGYMVSNPNLYNGYRREFAGQWQIGVVMNVPLFHWGERVHTLRAAANEKNCAQYQLEDAKEKVELDITQAGFKTVEAEKKSKMTGYNKEKAEENLKYANIGYEAGTVTLSTLMEAQSAWLKANSDDIDAKIDMRLCTVYLEKALGKLK